MKKMTLQQDTQMTLADGCKKHYEYCRQRNLREGTLLHYQQGYNHFCSYFGADMPLSEINKSKYNDYIEYQRDNLDEEDMNKTQSRVLMHTALCFKIQKNSVNCPLPGNRP